MANEIASIGVAMQTDGIERGIKTLDVLAAAGPRVEKALDGVEKTATKAGKSLRTIGEGAGKGLDDVGRAAPKAAEGVGRVAKSADDAKKALAGINASVAGLSQVSAAATQSARSMLGFGSSVQASQKSLIDMQAQVRAASTAVAQMSSAMTSALPSMQAAAKAQMDAAKSAVDMGAAFKTAGDQVRAYSTVSARASDASQKSAQSMDATAAAARGLASALAVAGVGFGAQELIGMVDGYTKYNAQLKIATRSTTEHAIAIASVQSTATKAQAGIGELATLYARITNATRDLGISQTRVGEIAETVALALKANGASAGEASSAMLQLSQAFGSGVLRGEEFNAVYEAAPNLLNELAVAMGKPIGSLRQMAADGKLTADVLAENLPKALGKFREQAAEVQTISGAFTVLKNNIMEMVGAQSNASGTTKALSSGINGLANNLDLVAAAGSAVAVVIGARLAASIASSGVAFAASAIQAARYQAVLASMAGVSGATATGLVAMGAAARGASAAMAFVGGPIGAVVAVAGLAATAFYAFGSSAGELTKSIGGLGQPLDDLKKRLDALPPEKRISVILDIKEEAAKKAKEAVSSYDDLAASMVGAFSGARAATADSAKQVNDLVEKLEDAKKTGADMTPILIEAAKSSKVSNATLKSWLELAANIREAREASKTGESLGAPGINVGAFPSRGSQSNYDKERAAAAEKLLEITARQSGITKQFTDDLKTYQDALKAGVMTEKEYAAAVTEANKKRYEGTEAGKAAAKQAKAGASGVNAHNQELERQAALLAELSGLSSSFYKDWDSLNKRYAQGRISIKGLEEAQAALLAKQPAMVALAKEEAEVSKARVKAWEEEVKGWQKQVEERNKAAESAEDALLKAREEERAHALAAAANITLAEAVARLTLARAEDNYQKALSKGSDGETLLALQRETDARRSLIEVMQQKGVREANEKAAETISKEWEKTSQLIGDTLADFIMSGGDDAATYLKRLFATLVLQPIVQYGVNSAMGALGMGQQGSAVQSVLGGNNVGSTVLNNAGAIGAGYQAIYGASVGASSASLLGANAVGLMGGDAIGTLAAANGMWAGVATSASQAAVAANLAMEAGTAVALEAGTLSAAASGAAASAGSLMSGFMAAAPWIAGAVALLSIIKGFDDSGTPHSGAGAVYSKLSGVQSGAGIYNQSTFGMGHRDEYSEAMQAGISGIAQGLGQTLDSFAVSFGKTAGYSVATAFADDSSKDGSWGSLKIADELGKVLVSWEDSRASKWAPREFADGEDGYKEYLNAVAVDVKAAFLTMDLPAWANQALKAATDIDTLTAALQQIATIKSVLDGLGKTMSMFAGLSGDLQTRLLAASGGVEALASNAGAFYEGFYTEGERALKQRELQMAALGRMGLYIDPAEGDAAKAAFKKTVQDAMGSGQVELAAQLMAMAGPFAQLADFAQQFADEAAQAAKSLRESLISLEGQFAGGGLSRQYRAEDAAGQMQKLLSSAGVQMEVGTLASVMMSATSAEVEHYFREIWKVLPTDAAKAELVGLASTMMDLAAATDAARESAAQAAAQSMSGAWSNFGTMAGLAAQYTGNTAGLSQQLGVVQGSYANATTTDGRVAALQQIINLEQGLWNGQQAARQAESAAATARASAAREQVNAAKQLLSAAQGLGTYAKSLGFSEASGLGEAERLAALDSERRDLLAKARAGDTGAMQDLQGVTGNYLTLAQQMAVSQQDYSVLSGRIAAELAATAAIQEASASSQVSQYERQIAAAESVAASSAGQFTVSAATQKLIDELLVESATAFETEATLAQKLIDQGVMTTAALQSLPAELAGAIGASLIPAIAGLASAMSSAAGISVPQFAEGGFHAGGLRIVGEREPELEATGPSRVWNQSQLAGALGGNNNAALVAAVDRLTAQNARMSAELAEIKASTSKLAEQFDSVSAGGNALLTEAMA